MRTRFTWQLATLLSLALVACGGDGSNHNNDGSCGDGTVGAGETCDDGNTASGDGCSATCTIETASKCGNNVVDVATETCDDGNTVSGDGCSATCQNEVVNLCGNGALNAPEACDDGNTASGDGCSTACVVEAGYTCTGTPSVCAMADGSCTAPFALTLANNNGTYTGTGTGDTTTTTSHFAEAPCDSVTSGAGNDHIWKFTLPAMTNVSIVLDATTSFDGAIRLLTAPCDVATEVIDTLRGVDGCADAHGQGAAEELGYRQLPAGTYYVVVDGYDATEMGTYSFTVTATPAMCGNGALDILETCDDGNMTANDGCSANCTVEPGYACTGTPSVCTSTCGNGTLDDGEECEDGNTAAGDRCSPTCTLEYDVLEVEPNDTTAQAIPAGNHKLIRGSLTDGDVDLYTFTLTAPATVELETYDTMDNLDNYGGVGNYTNLDCINSTDSIVALFSAAGDVTMDATALAIDNDDGDVYCSYLGPNDSTDDQLETGADPTQGVLPAGTYRIRVTADPVTPTSSRYILDLKITPTTSATPVPPVAGDLALNEFMAADSTADTNCDGVTTSTTDEFVELVNVSTKTLDLTGVTISDAAVLQHTFAAAASGSLTLAPGKAVVVWGGGAPNCPGVTNWFTASSGQLSLNDGGDTINVRTAGAAPVSLLSVTYAAATATISANLSPDVTGTTYALHNAVTGAVGTFSPGKKANGTAF